MLSFISVKTKRQTLIFLYFESHYKISAVSTVPNRSRPFLQV